MAPSYDYHCPQCANHSTIRHPISAPRPCCPRCEGPLRRVISAAPAFHGHGARGREEAVRLLESSRSATCPACRTSCRHG
jgi:putative FmdB family regulatory protein